jgi:hypothetical protein
MSADQAELSGKAIAANMKANFLIDEQLRLSLVDWSLGFGHGGIMELMPHWYLVKRNPILLNMFYHVQYNK